MKANVGRTDKVVRIVVGLGAMGAGIYFRSWWGALGVIPLATALVGWCPLYCPLKLSTRKEQD